MKSPKDIIAHLCLKYPPEVIHSITTENIIAAIVRPMGEEALGLSLEDLELARDEVAPHWSITWMRGSISILASTAGIFSETCNFNLKGDIMARKSKRDNVIFNIILFFVVTGIVTKLLPYIIFLIIIRITMNLSKWLS
jgi:hypothetical protein